jgi:hypothetical protein
MATKDLARTVIEGGRTYFNSFSRRHSHRRPRAHWTVLRSRLLLDPGLHDDPYVAPPAHEWRQFHDKLGPVYRFLESRVGRRWDDVRSEIARKFDIRTVAGRHIVFDHLLGSVARCGDPARGERFEIDASGVLRRKRRRKRVGARCWVVPPEWLEGWLAGRRVGLRAKRAYWMLPVIAFDGVSSFYRQGRELTADDRRRFGRLHPEVQESITIVLEPDPPLRAGRPR